MPDETPEQPPAEAAEESLETPETPPVEETPSTEPHPLEPDGARFKQVWARAKSAEEKAARLEAEVEAIKTAQQNTQQPTKLSLEEQVEAAVESGTMTQIQAIRLLSRQYAKEEARATVQQETQATTEQQRLQEASDGIKAFVDVAPDIETLTHPRIGEVKAHYDTLLRRGHKPGLPTELLSLEMTFGSPEKLKRNRTPSDRASDHVSSGGATIQPARPDTKNELAGIPKRYIDYWQSRHYSKEDMVAESKYFTAEQKSRKD